MITLEKLVTELDVNQIDEVNAGTIWNWFGYTLTTNTDGKWEITTNTEGHTW